MIGVIGTICVSGVIGGIGVMGAIGAVGAIGAIETKRQDSGANKTNKMENFEKKSLSHSQCRCREFPPLFPEYFLSSIFRLLVEYLRICTV